MLQALVALHVKLSRIHRSVAVDADQLITGRNDDAPVKDAGSFLDDPSIQKRAHVEL